MYPNMFKVQDCDFRDYSFPCFNFEEKHAPATYMLKSQNGRKGSQYQILRVMHLVELITSL